jgi:hypothetical protein
MSVDFQTRYSRDLTEKKNENDIINYNIGRTVEPEILEIRKKNDIENKIQSRINGDQRLGINTNTDEYKKATELFENALNNGEYVNENTQMLEQPVYLKHLKHLEQKFEIIKGKMMELYKTLEYNEHIQKFLSNNNNNVEILLEQFQKLLNNVDNDLNNINLENEKIKIILLYFCVKKEKQDFFIKVGKDNDIKNNLEYYLTNLFEPNPEQNLEQNPKPKQNPKSKNRNIINRIISPPSINGGKKTKRIHKKKSRKQKKSKKMRL